MKTLMILSTVPDERLEIALMEAKEAGYNTLFCGRQGDSVDGVFADSICQADWDDTDQLLRIAKAGNIDGVLGLCDPAVIPAAKVAEALKLPGNPVASVEKLLSKNAFRTLQEQSGVFCPRHVIVNGPDEMKNACRDFRLPVIVKPVLSSSSHGMTTLYDMRDVDRAFREASETSRNGAVCVEEFIENPLLRVIESDLFVFEDNYLWDGIRYCYRLPQAPLRPVYDVYPVTLTDQEEAEYKRSVSAVLRQAGIRFGEFNVEGFFTEEKRFFIIEINPRPAGHYTPQTVQFYTGMNLAKLLVTTAVGDTAYCNEVKGGKREQRWHYLLDHSVFSEKDGVFVKIHMDEGIRKHHQVTRFLHGQKEGDRVRNIIDAVRPIAVMIFTFDTREELEYARAHITELVYPIVHEDESSNDL